MSSLLQRFKQLPRGVLGFVVLVLVYDVVALVVDWRWFHGHPRATACWFLISLGTLAAIVVWRQRDG
jgi:hypothetical protein